MSSGPDCETKILVVEDDPMNLEFMRDALELSGYRVVEAESATFQKTS